MLEKNQELEVIIEGVGSEAQGVARVDGFVVFVPFALKGEKVKIHIIKVTKNYAVGKIVEIIMSSKDRVEPICAVYKKCGGCSLQHCAYKGSLEIKKQIVEDAIHKIGGFADAKVSDVVGSSYSYNYRNKAAFPLFVNNGNVEVCMYRGLSHDPVYIDDCVISDVKINKIARVFKDFVNKNYSLEQKEALKHLVIRVIEDKVLIAIVSGKKLEKSKALFDSFVNELNLNENMVGLYACKKSKDNNVILEGKLTHLHGIENITTDLLGISVEISPMSFFQVNIDVMKKIYNKVLEQVKTDEVVVDAYSGAGLLSALISKRAKKVYGIEIVSEATKNANSLKENNKIDNLSNINGDVSLVLPSLVKEIKSDFTLVLDPPRKGVDVKVVNTISEVMPEKILYVSCNPASLARDLKLICEAGYKIVSIEPFDMFPQTNHVETYAVLEKC